MDLKQNLTETREFLNTIFCAKPNDTYIGLWKNKKSFWFKTVDEIIEHLWSLLDLNDVYFHLGLTRKEIPSNRRIKAVDVCAITCLWADVDFGGPSANGKARPGTVDEAWELCMSSLPALTWMNHSGHGLHAYSVGQHPYEIDSEAAQHGATRISRAYQDKLRGAYAGHFYHLDSTHDLARVLRLPGTQNTKGRVDGEADLPVHRIWPQNVTGGQIAGSRGLWDLFGDETPPEPAQSAKKKARPTEPAKPLSLTDLPDPKTIQAACDNDLVFRATWNKLRLDLNDPSPSGYDMAIAHAAIRLGWSDGGTAKLILARRLEADEGVRKILTRPEYVIETIRKARAGLAILGATAKEPSAIESREPVELVDSNLSPEKRRQEIFTMISSFFNFEVAGVIRHGKGRTAWSIIVKIEEEDEEVLIGTTQQFLTRNFFNSRIFEAIGQNAPVAKKADWERTCAMMFEVAEYHELPSLREEHVGFLSSYLRTNAFNDMTTDESLSQMLGERAPMIYEGCLCINSRKYHHHVTVTIGAREVSMPEVYSALRQLGFKVKTLSNANKDGHRVQVKYWSIPKESATASELI